MTPTFGESRMMVKKHLAAIDCAQLDKRCVHDNDA